MKVRVKEREVILDEDDMPLFLASAWTIDVHATHPYLCRYKKQAGRLQAVLFHREILGVPKGLCVDHINGNTLDNRRENLRACTHAENMRNRKMHSNNKSGYKGVYKVVRNNVVRYAAQIRFNGKRYQLGKFKTPELASEAYIAGAAKLHGEFKRE